MSDDDFMDSGEDNFDMDDFMEDEGGSDVGSDPQGSDDDDDDEDAGATKKDRKLTKVDLENQYYKSKDLEEDKGVEVAIQGFLKVIEMEKVVLNKYVSWSFKGLKKVI